MYIQQITNAENGIKTPQLPNWIDFYASIKNLTWKDVRKDLAIAKQGVDHTIADSFTRKNEGDSCWNTGVGAVSWKADNSNLQGGATGLTCMTRIRALSDNYSSKTKTRVCIIRNSPDCSTCGYAILLYETLAPSVWARLVLSDGTLKQASVGYTEGQVIAKHIDLMLLWDKIAGDLTIKLWYLEYGDTSVSATISGVTSIKTDCMDYLVGACDNDVPDTYPVYQKVMVANKLLSTNEIDHVRKLFYLI